MLGVVVFCLKILHVFDVLDEAFMNVVKIGRKFFSGGGSVR